MTDIEITLAILESMFPVGFEKLARIKKFNFTKEELEEIYHECQEIIKTDECWQHKNGNLRKLIYMQMYKHAGYDY